MVTLITISKFTVYIVLKVQDTIDEKIKYLLRRTLQKASTICHVYFTR